MGPGRVPGGEIGLFRRVVEKDPVKRIVRIVRERGGGRLGDAAAVDDHEVGDRIAPPKGVLVEIVGRLDLVADGFENPRNLVQQRHVLRNHNDVQADGVRTTSGSILPNAGIGAFDPLTTLAQARFCRPPESPRRRRDSRQMLGFLMGIPQNPARLPARDRLIPFRPHQSHARAHGRSDLVSPLTGDHRDPHHALEKDDLQTEPRVLLRRQRRSSPRDDREISVSHRPGRRRRTCASNRSKSRASTPRSSNGTACGWCATWAAPTARKSTASRSRRRCSPTATSSKSPRRS